MRLIVCCQKSNNRIMLQTSFHGVVQKVPFLGNTGATIPAQKVDQI
jgi:hypothetical protein